MYDDVDGVFPCICVRRAECRYCRYIHIAYVPPPMTPVHAAAHWAGPLADCADGPAVRAPRRPARGRRHQPPRSGVRRGARACGPGIKVDARRCRCWQVGAVDTPAITVRTFHITVYTARPAKLVVTELGSLCEYIGHLCYKWLNYYVRMSKTSKMHHHERF